MTVYGTLLDVHTDAVGEPLTADAIATATTIAVVDATTFREEGGLLKIGQDVYTYTAIDPDLNIVTLASGLLRAVATDDLVEVYPTTLVKRAFVDTGIGGDAEGVWATVPQSMVLTLPDGLRYEGQRETVLLTERGPGELIISDVQAAANVAASTVLPEGSVDTHLLQVGVTGNLVQDPDFTSNFWQPPRKFTIAGPDAVYTDSNFIRNTGTTELNAPEDGGDQYDWTWWLTDVVPVDPGRTVRVKVLTRRDAASIVGTVGPQTARARVRVVFYKADKDTATSVFPYFTSLVLATDIVADTWALIQQSSLVPEGYTYFKAGVQVTGTTAGNVDFIKPEVQIIWNQVQSGDYVRGETGWNLEGGITQFPSVNVLDTIGAGTISARSITINGQDLETEYLSPLPLGVVAFDQSSSGVSTAAISTPETKLFEFSSPMLALRLYRIVFEGHVQGSVGNDTFDFCLRRTLDGTTPTVTSPAMRTWRVAIPASSPSTAIQLEKIYSPASDIPNIRFSFSVVRAFGTGTVFVHNTDPNRYPVMYVEDVGLYGPAAIAGTLSQTSGVVQPAPKVTTTGVWWATWGRSFREAAGTTLTGDPADLYQGTPYYASDWGNSRSLFGFDYAAIQTALSGATINWVKLVYRTKDVYEYPPYCTVSVASHTYTTKPSTWSAASVTTGRANFSGRQMGATYTDTLPVAIGNEFKAGTTRGLGFGPGLTGTDFGSMYGAITSTDRPRLQINYTK